jgi:hypothetical protein
VRLASAIALAALGTLSFGAVPVPQAPLIALGSVVGMTVTAFVRLGGREQNVVAAAGSFRRSRRCSAGRWWAG